jgi:hypothetical protein
MESEERAARAAKGRLVHSLVYKSLVKLDQASSKGSNSRELKEQWRCT